MKDPYRDSFSVEYQKPARKNRIVISNKRGFKQFICGQKDAFVPVGKVFNRHLSPEIKVKTVLQTRKTSHVEYATAPETCDPVV